MEYLIISLLFYGLQSCEIQGSDTGECSPWSKNADFMPFCGQVVTYDACIPRYSELWSNHSLFEKDKWVAEMFNKIVSDRKKYETNTTLQDLGMIFTSKPELISLRNQRKGATWLRCDEILRKPGESPKRLRTCF